MDGVGWGCMDRAQVVRLMMKACMHVGATLVSIGDSLDEAHPPTGTLCTLDELSVLCQ